MANTSVHPSVRLEIDMVTYKDCTFYCSDRKEFDELVAKEKATVYGDEAEIDDEDNPGYGCVICIEPDLDQRT